MLLCREGSSVEEGIFRPRRAPQRSVSVEEGTFRRGIVLAPFCSGKIRMTLEDFVVRGVYSLRNDSSVGDRLTRIGQEAKTTGEGLESNAAPGVHDPGTRPVTEETGIDR